MDLTKRGLWLWRMPNIRRDWLEQSVKLGVQRLYIKAFDDASPSLFWDWQMSKELVDKIHAAGIECWAWGYHFSRIGTKLHAVTPVWEHILPSLAKVFACGVKGYVVDVEAELENRHMHKYLERLLTEIHMLKEDDDKPLGYTSFGCPKFHPKFPWQIVDNLCNVAMPQIYYEKFTFGPGHPSWMENAREIKACLDAHKELKLQLPICPIWGSESDAKYPTGASEIQSYLSQFPGSSVWRAPDVGKKGVAWELDYTGTKTVV